MPQMMPINWLISFFFFIFMFFMFNILNYYIFIIINNKINTTKLINKNKNFIWKW